MPSRLRHGVDRFLYKQQPENSSSTPPPPPQLAQTRRPTLFQRLHLSSHSRKKPKPPKLHIERPTTSSSLPIVRSSSQTRAVSSHSTDAATIAEITSMMPQSLDLGSQSDRKRQRSRDSRKAAAGGDEHGRKASTDTERLARQGIRMPAYLSKTKSEITVAFQDLEWKQRSRLAAALTNPNSPFKVDRSYATAARNRYLNIQPWDNSRVRLKNPIGGSDYINASPIKLRTPRKTRRARSSSSASVAAIQDYNYIATQGPKEGQFSHFWHMVMQETTGPVGAIVMLTLCYEANKEKCGQYFPADADHPIFLAPERIHNEAAKPPDDGDPFIDSPRSSAGTDSSDSGTTSSPPSEATSATNPDEAQASEPETAAGSVELVSIQNDASVGAEVRELKLTIGGQTKTIYHYLYSHWPDFGKPENEERAALMQLMKVSKQVASESPRVVHCSAGVGRTGTFIALDFLISELEAGRLARRVPESNSSSDDYFESSRRHGMDSGSRSPSKDQTTTPELPQGETAQGKAKETDLIKDTVDLLRQQRMMMVMNELQFTLLYEVVRDAFVHMYAEKEVGALVTGTADADAEGPSPKIARTISAQLKDGGGGVYDDTKVGTVKGDEDTVSEPGGGPSEAETEIEDAESGLTQDVKMQMTMGGAEEDDPYAAVAPERIREGMRGERVEGGGDDTK